MIRTYNDLTNELKQKAIQSCLNDLMSGITEGFIRFNDKLNEDNLQTKIDKAIEEADRMQTPWFAGEYIIEAVGETLQSMAQCRAEEAFYPTEENFIYL